MKYLKSLTLLMLLLTASLQGFAQNGITEKYIFSSLPGVSSSFVQLNAYNNKILAYSLKQITCLSSNLDSL